MPNIFAYLVLYGWPLVAFLMYWKLPLHRAFIWSILIGYLFMPPASAAFDLPALPEFTKLEIAAVSSFVMAVAFHGVSFIRIPKSPVLLTLNCRVSFRSDFYSADKLGKRGLRPIHA